MTKAEKLRELESEMAADKGLPLGSNLVFGEGNPESKVVFIGEAPGAEEDRLVRPFVGRSGQVLRKNIRAIGWKEDDVYITNIVKRRPPDNRDPLPEEIAAYQPYLKRQMDIIAPEVIVTLGRFSMNHFLPDARISRDQGKIFRLKNLIVYPVYHPAAGLRSTEVMGEFERSIARLPKVMEKAKELLSEPVAEKKKDERSAQEKLF